MAANAKPLILYDNRLDDGTPTATDTAAGYDVLNLKDLRTYTYWIAGGFGTKYVTVDTYAKSSVNMFNQALFAGLGTMEVITTWAILKSGCTIAKIAGGSSGNCMEMTRTSGDLQYSYLYLEDMTGFTLGLTYTIEAYVKSGTSGNEAFRIQIMSDRFDLLGEITGTSSGTWTKYSFEWLCTDVDPVVRLVKDTATAGTMLFDEVAIYGGYIGTADSLAIIGHNFAAAAATVSVEMSNDNAAWTERLAGFTVSTDKALLKTFASVAARYWRLKIVTAAIAPRMAILMIGSRLDFERYAAGEWLGPQESIVAESIRSETGNLLGSTLKYTGLSFDLSFRFLTLTWAESTFKSAWDDYLSLLKPFFFAPDVTNHATEVYFVKIPDNFKLRMPHTSGGTRRNLDLTFEGLKEA
jgi:hypothetical protein